MNQQLPINQDEQAAREALRLAISERDALQKQLCTSADERNDLLKMAEDKEALAHDAEVARAEAEASGSDKLILNTVSKESEAKALAAAARTRADRATERFEIIRIQHDEAERSVSRQTGAVLAAAGEDRAARAAAAWLGIVHELAALRARAKLLNAPIGPRSQILAVAANDSNFPISYRSTRDNLNAVIDTLSRDSDAPLNLR